MPKFGFLRFLYRLLESMLELWSVWVMGLLITILLGGALFLGGSFENVDWSSADHARLTALVVLHDLGLYSQNPETPDLWEGFVRAGIRLIGVILFGVLVGVVANGVMRELPDYPKLKEVE